MLAADDHRVTVIDWNQEAFDRLAEDFPGDTVLGNAIDVDVLREAGADSADAFVAATSGDNRNIMASEIAREVFRVPRVICRVKDPNRAKIFGQMGISIDCRTMEGANAILEIIGASDRVIC